MVYKFFDKKSAGSSVNTPLELDEQLDEELQKPIIKNSKKSKVYSGFRGNIWGADLADMQLISKFNMLFKKYWYLIENLIKYGLIKEVNFTIILLKNG